MFQEAKELFNYPIRILTARQAPQESDHEVLENLLRYLARSKIPTAVNDNRIWHN